MRSSPALSVALVVAALLAPLALAQPTPTPWPPTTTPTSGPGNDMRWNATYLTVGNTTTQSLVGATPNQWWESSICTYGPNVWFAVYLPNATGLRIDTTGSVDVHAIGVYQGSPSWDNWYGCAYGDNVSSPILERSVLRGWYYIEVSGSNETGSLTLTVTTDDSLAPYDLDAMYGYASGWQSEHVVGEPVDLLFAFQSLGKRIDQTFWLSYQISGWTGGDIQVNGTGNESYFYRFATFTPEYAGTYEVYFYVDSFGQIDEFSESNNWYSFSFEVLPAPDAAVNITDLRRVPLRTEAGDLRHPLALWEADVQVCNLGGGQIPVMVNMTMLGGGQHAGGMGNASLGQFESWVGVYECQTTTIRFSTAQAIGDFTIVAEGSAPRDANPWNNVDTAEGYNLVAETIGVVIGVDGLLP